MAKLNNQDLIDVDEVKFMAAMSYVVVFLPLLMNKDNDFVRWHTRQGLVLLIGIVLAWVATYWWSSVGTTIFLVLLLADVIALVQALLGKRWKVPLVGDLAKKFRV